jgi:hypothetical protein
MALTQKQVDDAIAYNKKQGYCDDQIKLVQKTVGVTEDGKWGPETVQAVADWQAANGLTADGKVGPETWDAIKSSWELVPVDPPEDREVEIGCGLAAYDQTFPGHKPEAAMDKAFDTAVAEGCKEIRFWSSEWLIPEELPHGGNKGNHYSGAWLEQKTIPPGVVVGAWIDDPVHDVKKPAFADHLARMHITRAALMINKSNTLTTQVPWALRWDRDDLKEVADLFHSRGIECVATCWPRPSKSMIDTMCEDMAWILPLIGSTTFEVDTEGNWDKKFLQGFRTMQEAADYLAAKMRELVGEDGKLELTTFTYHTENSSNARLAPLMDRLLPQAYSVRHRSNATVEWNDSLGPGKHQTLAVSRARQAAAAG